MNLQEKGVPAGEKKHALSLKKRERLVLEGVLEVLSFDEGSVQLKTDLGALTVEGEELRVAKLLLESGEVIVEGRIDSIFYEEGRNGRRARLFGR